MKNDVAVVGGGLAGSLAAAMLGRAGYRVALIDMHTVYPADFRCEKLDESQVSLLRQTGLADIVLRDGALDSEVWIARYGRLIERRPSARYGIRYETLVNSIRSAIPAGVERIVGKAIDIRTGGETQSVLLSSGAESRARLVVLANGLNSGLRETIAIHRSEVSRSHSISIGFDLKPAGRPVFQFPALTYYPEKASDRVAYLTLFPMGSIMRANLFVYWGLRDPRLKAFRDGPEEALNELMPRLPRLTGDFRIVGPVKIRPVDLYVSQNYLRPGLVLVGDAFATSCPAVGTGANKVITDVERLCNRYIPHWLANPGMGEEKISAFYNDRTKLACDTYSASMAFYLRSLSCGEQFRWRAARWGRLVGQLGLGMVRHIRQKTGPFRSIPCRTDLRDGLALHKPSARCKSLRLREG
jgi:2-polyprenyl-6-methoxyphenol hydroxylase-like FAD-dependent oxidoreductase